MAEFSKIEPSYISKEGCRLIWKEVEEDDQHVVVLNKDEFEQLFEILSKDSTGIIRLEDEYSRILINTDVTQFQLKELKTLVVKTSILRKNVLEYKNVPHEPKPIKIYPKEFYPSIEIEKEGDDEQNKLLNAVLTAKNKDVVSESDLFRVMATRRSTRNFDVSMPIEQWKTEKSKII